jgi:hypothetical protein
MLVLGSTYLGTAGSSSRWRRGALPLWTVERRTRPDRSSARALPTASSVCAGVNIGAVFTAVFVRAALAAFMSRLTGTACTQAWTARC